MRNIEIMSYGSIKLIIVNLIMLVKLYLLFFMCFSILFGGENSIVGLITIIALLIFRFSNLDLDVTLSFSNVKNNIGLVGGLMVGFSATYQWQKLKRPVFD